MLSVQETFFTKDVVVVVIATVVALVRQCVGRDRLRTERLRQLGVLALGLFIAFLGSCVSG